MQELIKSVYGTTPVGALIAALEAAPQDADVQYDFCYLRPTKVDSYRGYYDHLALGWSDQSVNDDAGKFVRHWPPVSDVLKELQSAIGKTFSGWKGGLYTMRNSTPLWVANPGEAGGTGIVGIDIDLSTVTLITAKVD